MPSIGVWGIDFTWHAVSLLQSKYFDQAFLQISPKLKDLKWKFHKLKKLKMQFLFKVCMTVQMPHTEQSNVLSAPVNQLLLFYF